MGECLLARHGGMGKTQSKIQLISYVGTGTTGRDGACSITAEFEIACAFMIGSSYMLGAYMIGNQLSESYIQHKGFCTDYGSPYGYGKKSADGKTFYWYNKYADDQFNTSGETYYVLVMGV